MKVELIDTPVYPGEVAVLSDIVPAPELSRRKPWFPGRLGFVGSRWGYDCLRFECETLILDLETAPTLLASGMIDAVVLEGAVDEVSGAWRDGFFDYGSCCSEPVSLVAEARRNGVPVIAYLNGPAGRVPLFLPLALAADEVIVTFGGARDALARHGIAAKLAPAPVQTALFHGFTPQIVSPSQPSSVLSLELPRATMDATVAEALRSLIPFGITVGSAGETVQMSSLPLLKELRTSIEGGLTGGQLEAILSRHDFLVQIARPDRDEGRAAELGLAAAASRCGLFVLGQLAPDDPRNGLAVQCSSQSELCARISELLMDPVRAEKQRQRIWRRAHVDHGAQSLMRVVAAAIGQDASADGPHASIVCPSNRPERLGEVLRQYRAQTWPRRDLLIVANTDHPIEWDVELLDIEHEQIVFLSSDHAAGSAMNIGAARAKGDYVMRMDDDDLYGPAYVQDMMLAATALAADILAKPPCFYHYCDDNMFVYRRDNMSSPNAYSSDRIADLDVGHLSGFTQAARKSVFDRISFTGRLRNAADSSFLHKARDCKDLLCACTDSMNVVIVRRSDLDTHTWRNAMKKDDPRLSTVSISLQNFLTE